MHINARFVTSIALRLWHLGARLLGLLAQSLVGRLQKRIHVFERINIVIQGMFCHIYCAQLGASWVKIVGASRAVSGRKTYTYSST